MEIVTGSCGHSYGYPVSMRGSEFLYQLSDYQLPRILFWGVRKKALYIHHQKASAVIKNASSCSICMRSRIRILNSDKFSSLKELRSTRGNYLFARKSQILELLDLLRGEQINVNTDGWAEMTIKVKHGFRLEDPSLFCVFNMSPLLCTQDARL